MPWAIEGERIRELAEALAERFGNPPDWVVVAGSGLARIAETLSDPDVVPYASFPNLAAPSVTGHSAHVVVGKIGQSRVAVFCGRSHIYEHGDAERAVRTVRAAAAWGCRNLILTNAAGGLNPAFETGGLMVIADQINFTFRCPRQAGILSVDMRKAYDMPLRVAAIHAASALRIRLHEGVYAGNLGPTYETDAEARMLRLLGADVVGMSTVAEAIAARQAGLRLMGLSHISNSLVRKTDGKTTHEEVLANSSLAAGRIIQLISAVIEDPAVSP